MASSTMRFFAHYSLVSYSLPGKVRCAKRSRGNIIDFKDRRVVDHSAIDALNKVTERYRKVSKKIHTPKTS